jgi:two-component system response regulator HydG
VKFLRAIQEKEVTPLGSTRPVRVDVRIIAATNRDIEDVLRSGTFRTDLFYRLNVVPIHLPPLRERREDIPLLAERFIEEFSRIYGVEPKRVTAEAMERICEYAWPGNIRELQNAIERAFALSSEPEITLKDLPPALLRVDNRAAGDAADTASLPLDEVERRSIVAALQRAGGNKNEAARLLGIDRQRLYRKIEKYGLLS